ncbi:MAG: PilT/PilU family type 4a pilus ATPase [Alphaproteobacteria bacterium]
MDNAKLAFEYFSAMAEYKASDLYLTVGAPPTLRVEDDLIEIAGQSLSINDINEILNAVLTVRQKREFEAAMELNTSLDMGEHGRFRVNILRQRQAPALVIRRVVSNIPSFSDLKLPRMFETLSMEKRGLVLLTGMTGSGKSTSLASMVDYRNANKKGHIITIEDPIEYFHEHKKSVVTQREIGVDTQSYASALKNTLRQRPDVILIGEIRDREVMEQALTISETGHLCLATIHTNNAYQAIERIVNFFPDEQGQQVRLNLSMNLKAIISQRLLPGIEKTLVPAVEVMLNQGLVRELILRGDVPKIQEIMEQTNQSGMCSFDQSILELYAQGLITEDVALRNSDKPSDLKIRIRQLRMSGAEKKAGTPLSSVDTSVISFSE